MAVNGDITGQDYFLLFCIHILCLMGFCVFREWQQCFFRLHVDGFGVDCVLIFYCRLWLPEDSVCAVLKVGGKFVLKKTRPVECVRICGWLADEILFV